MVVFCGEDDGDGKVGRYPNTYVLHLGESPLTLTFTPDEIMGLPESFRDEADMPGDWR